jgi:hypothetical protein
MNTAHPQLHTPNDSLDVKWYSGTINTTANATRLNALIVNRFISNHINPPNFGIKNKAIFTPISPY